MGPIAASSSLTAAAELWALGRGDLCAACRSPQLQWRALASRAVQPCKSRLSLKLAKLGADANTALDAIHQLESSQIPLALEIAVEQSNS
jgi:hypothetical protein